MSDQNGRHDGTQNGPGEQIRPKRDDTDRDRSSLGSGRSRERPTEDDLARKDAGKRTPSDGGGK